MGVLVAPRLIECGPIEIADRPVGAGLEQRL